MFRLAPIPQSPAYHHFADQRAWLGIPNCLNVISNLPFAIVGFIGILFLRRTSNSRQHVFIDSRERRPYLGVFIGLFLTAFGSAYYHLSPNNARLVWDRLPMTIVFASLVSAIIMERLSLRLGLQLLSWLIAFSAASVLQWYCDELHGRGDLRVYAAVQAYSALVLLLAMLLPRRYSRGSDYAVIFAFYAFAKIFEAADRKIFSLGHIISGHTLKHLSAATAGYWMVRMLQLREPCPEQFIAS